MNTIHNIKVKKMDRYIEKIKGLMFTSKPFSVYFETRFGIHTYFVKFPVDVLIIDSENIVRAFKKHLQPNQLFIWNPKYSRVLELPDGYIENHKITLGSKIKTQFC